MKRVPLYERLPEIYRIRDAGQGDALQAYLAAVEGAFGAVHESIEALYDDLFIDTCDDWVIPYIADLVGTSHLKGEPRTLRADVADTIAMRRRKGTLGAIERLAANLTDWACRCVELRENLGWTQHLNHQRPDAGGQPPYGGDRITRFRVRRGGTAPIRDPAKLALLDTPFDDFAYTAEVKSAGRELFGDGAIRRNLPNLAIFLWRLQAYRIDVRLPLAKGFVDLGPPPSGSDRARYAVRFDLDPLDRAVRLFNTLRRAEDRLTELDAVPGPILDARLTSGADAGNPGAYVSIDAFDDTVAPPQGLDASELGLQLFFPDAALVAMDWTFRGDNLCAWHEGLRRPLRRYEIVIDADIGRLLIGVRTAAERNVLVSGAGMEPRIYCGYTYAAPGPVGAHPVSRKPAPETIEGAAVDRREVSAFPGGTSLQSVLSGIAGAGQPVVVEIMDSLVHLLDLGELALSSSLVVRAASGHRPIVLLAGPLRFRAATPGAGLLLRFEGLHFARAPDYPAGAPLLSRATVARLELDGCTLDPGGCRGRDPRVREPLHPGLNLATADATGSHEIVVQRSISGALAIDEPYRLKVNDSIVDAGGGFALSAATDPAAGWGAPLHVCGATFFGRVRTAEARGSGGIFAQRLEVWNNQRGCLKFCWFSGDGDRLPPNHGCVRAPDAKLTFTSEWFRDPGYAQLARTCDWRIRERGPNDDEMGAYNFLREAHKRANLQIRCREFMPVGVRPLLVPVT